MVIGVHAPEFAFEKKHHVRWAVKEMRIDHPVAVTMSMRYGQTFRKRLAGALFHRSASAFGTTIFEGSYEQSEMVIQTLAGRAERADSTDREPVSGSCRGIEAAADPDLWSAENYVGHERTQNFASPAGQS